MKKIIVTLFALSALFAGSVFAGGSRSGDVMSGRLYNKNSYVVHSDGVKELLSFERDIYQKSDIFPATLSGGEEQYDYTIAGDDWYGAPVWEYVAVSYFAQAAGGKVYGCFFKFNKSSQDIEALPLGIADSSNCRAYGSSVFMYFAIYE